MTFFDQEAIEKILKDPENKVDLSYEEMIYLKANRSEEKTGDFSWSFSWKYGCWTLPYKENEKEMAEMHTALFIYLWLKGVGLPLTDELAYLYTSSSFQLSAKAK